MDKGGYYISSPLSSVPEMKCLVHSPMVIQELYISPDELLVEGTVAKSFNTWLS